MNDWQKAIQCDLGDAIDGAAFLCAQDQMKGLQDDHYGRLQYGRLMGLVQAYHILNGNEIDFCRLGNYANEQVEKQLALIEGAA